MHTQGTALARSTARGEGAPALTAIVPLARPEQSDARGSSFALEVSGGGGLEEAPEVVVGEIRGIYVAGSSGDLEHPSPR